MKKYNYDNLYALQMDIPGFPAGTLFQYRERDNKRNLGSPMNGWLTNIWIEGDCQPANGNHIGWVAETHVFPGQLKGDEDFFKPVKLVATGSKTYRIKNLVFEEQS